MLFIDEIHTVVGAGASGGAMDASNLLKPSLARGQLRCIGATTLDEYRKHIEKDPALERRFQQVTFRRLPVTTLTERRHGQANGVALETCWLVCMNGTVAAAYALAPPFVSSEFEYPLGRASQVYVKEPSVAETVSILRGLRERYELHHKVRISDSALVEAAQMSAR